MTVASAERRATAQARLSAEIAKLRGLEERLPLHHRQVLHEVLTELARLRRDLAGVVVPDARRHANPSRAPGRVYTHKQREDVRHCPMHDHGEGAWLPVAEFGVKNKETGALRSWCKACTKAYQRQRYVKVTAKSITVTLVEGDRCVGKECPLCGYALSVGERVTGLDLHHEECQT